ncbi:DUF4189 domain-containing protein [Flavihumibacter sp. R14]|nr:DUF4189 domain-containing protein [Flavihumibacter soli]
MKHSFPLLLIFLLLFVFGPVAAQQHNLKAPTNCRYAKGPVPANYIACGACEKDKEKDKDARDEENRKRELAKPKYSALAVDRKNGFYYGWSYDYRTLAEAEQKALLECEKRGGDCSIVLSFSGAGCAAYRTISGTVGTAFGWGIAASKEEADAIATRECLERSEGKTPSNFVWACNSTTTAPLKEIYNAKDEIGGTEFKGKLGSTHTVAFSPDGKKLATGSGAYVRLWSYPSMKLLREMKSNDKYRGSITAVAFSPDGKTLASGENNEVKLWEVSTGKLIRVLGKHDYEVPGLSFSPDGKLLATGGEFSRDKGKIWDLATGNVIHELSGHEFGIRSTPFSPDGKTVATVSVDGSFKFWNAATGSLLRTMTATNEQLMEGEFSPDGKTFVTIAFDGDNSVKLWNVATGSLIRNFGSHDGYLGYAVNFYMGSDKIISAGYNDTMIIWDVQTGSRLATMSDTNIWRLAVAPDGTVAAAGVRGIQLWEPDGSGGLRKAKTIE